MKKILISFKLERFLYLLLIILTWFFTGKYTRDKDIYQASLSGVVESLKYNDRDKAYVQIKYKNTPGINVLSGIHNINFLEKGYLQEDDSIYKPMFSNIYYLYRKDKTDGEYKYLYTIKNE